MISFFSFSTITAGATRRASSSDMTEKAMTVITSPILPRCAAGPFGQNSRFGEQLRVDFEAALVIELAGRQPRKVNFAAQHDFLHNNNRIPIPQS